VIGSPYRYGTKNAHTQKVAKEPLRIAAIGASAGGLEAMTDLLEHLPAKTGLAYVYVQHLDPSHESLLAPILSRHTRITVLEAKQATPVLADHLYIVPPNSVMTIRKGVLRLAPARHRARILL